ncbi:Uncharacterized protein PRO82_001402 [Candidatus Protochlamydia amoebophila]|uniref:hypothetical protein n=1 Tax=Candidatus Protochlamydia amoebophila TaxID=362787 RepID=UPI001BC97902|nr:hypothetical protein [Candidatus Protochlamydia amoebophila]MBS4164086.1 Uncharacterized protein [Candidatus Protochlamydia amoebophila]
MEVAIIGLGAASVSLTEYYSINVLQKYTDLITPLKTIFSKDSSELTAEDYDLILKQVASLKQLAKEGVQDTNGTDTYQSFMNQAMVTPLNDIMKTLSIVGIPPDPNAGPLSDSAKIATLMGWKSLPNFQIDVLGPLNAALSIQLEAYQYTVNIENPGTGIISTLTVLASPGRSLQSMLELEYIGAGNTQMAGKMADLEQALSLSQQILKTLTGIQNISNEIQVYNKIPFKLPNTADLDDYKKQYKKQASAYFAQIFPTAEPVADSAQKLLNLKQSLWDQMVALEAANPTSGRNETGSLANAVYKVVQDISAAFVGVDLTAANAQDQLFASVKKWIMDNQDVRIDDAGSNKNAGAIQDRLASAMTTAQNLEESQREDVRRYLLLFQEFYKSAMSMIQLLGTIFDKINKGIFKE